jgi:DNA adenine methylase
MENFAIATNIEIEDSLAHLELKKIDKINTPFGYFGSKNRIASTLASELPLHSCWVEAFCGSAALTLSKRKAPIEVINDVDGEIINVFRQLRENQTELCRQVALTPYAKDELEQARHSNKADSDIERARKFLVQAMMAVNGMFGVERGGFSYSQSYTRNGRDARVNRWYNLPERIELVVERLRNVRVENRDAIELLEMFVKRPATLIYLDPPYLGERTKGYAQDANDDEFHVRLLKTALRSRSMIFISGYENEIYNNMLTTSKGWKKITIEATIKDIEGNKHDRKEVVWTNRPFRNTLKNKAMGLRLTKKEVSQGKVNPERK